MRFEYMRATFVPHIDYPLGTFGRLFFDLPIEVIEACYDSLVTWLNVQGQDGWELVNIFDAGGSNEYRWRCLFKRRAGERLR